MTSAALAAAEPAGLPASRLAPRDLLAAGTIGLRTRRLRASLSALGIAIGIASMVAVLGISASSKADLLAELDSLGTNLLTVAPGQSFLGEDATLPETASRALRGVGGVSTAAGTRTLDANVRRSDLIDKEETGGIAVAAADLELLSALQGQLASGTWLTNATSRRPVVVLGSVAAARLGIDSAATRPRVWLGNRWFTVAGILRSMKLAPEIDRSALVGFPAATSLLGSDTDPTTVYVRTAPDDVEQVRDVAGATANPEAPEEVDVSRPSDALAARAAAKGAFTSLLLGLGAVALLVGGVGIANVMVISVLERRPEIGLRRALGATRRHVGMQFAGESLILALLGGIAGVALGAAAVAAYAAARGWTIALPPAALAGGVGAALLVGALAGLYPALRAARLSPTEALRST
jgi:putative ABC transport system permease protein